MDPNETLSEIRRLLPEVDGEHHTHPIDPDDVFRLAELVTGLDEWLKRGGFLPNDWQRSYVQNKPEDATGVNNLETPIRSRFQPTDLNPGITDGSEEIQYWQDYTDENRD